MSSYDSLGMKKRINAFDTVTVYGGSRMSAKVLDAMAEASKCFVDLRELHRKAGERLAELTQNEAATITSGAASGSGCGCLYDRKRRGEDGQAARC